MTHSSDVTVVGAIRVIRDTVVGAIRVIRDTVVGAIRVIRDTVVGTIRVIPSRGDASAMRVTRRAVERQSE